jgi:hypothetical protein
MRPMKRKHGKRHQRNDGAHQNDDQPIEDQIADLDAWQLDTAFETDRQQDEDRQRFIDAARESSNPNATVRQPHRARKTNDGFKIHLCWDSWRCVHGRRRRCAFMNGLSG